MTPFSFHHACHEIVAGAGRLGYVWEVARRHGATRPMLVLDSYFADGPLARRLSDGFASPPAVHAVPPGEPDLASLDVCRAAMAHADPDLIVVVGGGSAMDCAKVARMLLCNPGDPLAIAGPVGVRMAPHPSLLIAAPTTAGTGSEVSLSAIIGRPGASAKLIFRAAEMTPSIAILDPELATSAPPGVTASSGYDAVTHAVEAYTSRMANPLTDLLALSAMERLARNLVLSFREPANLDARMQCLLASTEAAMAFNTANLGLAHAISGPMSALHHTPHGLANALALPWTMAFNALDLGPKQARITSIFGGVTAAGAMSRLRHELGLDLPLDRFVPAASLDELALAACQSGQVRMNPRAATLADVRAILEAMRTPTGGGEPCL